MADLYVMSDLFFETNEDDSATIACINSHASRLNSLICSLPLVQNKAKRRRKAQVINYVEAVMPLYQIDDFPERFRMHRETFHEFTERFSPVLMHGNRDGLMNIPVDKQLLIYIKYVSSQQTMQAIADLFGVCEATVYSPVRRITSVICTELMPEIIKWPRDHNVQPNVRDFKDRTGFPGVIGAIDGSRIPIGTPKDHPENYINRKKFHSIVLQAICDPNMHFIDVFCGWPGSVYDARVLKNSEIYWLATNTDNMFPGNVHLLGDAAYPLLDWL